MTEQDTPAPKTPWAIVQFVCSETTSVGSITQYPSRDEAMAAAVTKYGELEMNEYGIYCNDNPIYQIVPIQCTPSPSSKTA